MGSYFGNVVQNFELKRVGGAPKGHLFAPLWSIFVVAFFNWDTWKTSWMEEEEGNCNLYATGPTLPMTLNGPKYLKANFWSALGASEHCIIGLKLEVN